MALSVENISQYCLYKERNRTRNIIKNILDETDEIHEYLPWNGPYFPRNGETCLVVLHYVIKFIQNSHDHHGTTILSDTITRLDGLAAQHQKVVWSRQHQKRKLKMIAKEIAEIHVNSFNPQVQKFFKVPKLISHKENEIMAGFLDFLLQILNAETLFEDEQRLAPLQKELRFVLTFLGDIPFRSTQLELVKTILAEFEFVSNETGTFIYDCFFATHPIEPVRFHRDVDSLLRLLGLLNQKIKQHCIKFSEIPRGITPQANAIDSLFIVDSLLEDLENVINRRYVVPIDGIQDQIKTIHEEMMSSRTFLKDVEVAHYTYKHKEYCIQIRDVAYETEYLVNSYIVGNVPIWYLNLRLPAVIQNIKRIGIKLQDIKKDFDTDVLQVKKDFYKNYHSKLQKLLRM